MTQVFNIDRRLKKNKTTCQPLLEVVTEVWNVSNVTTQTDKYKTSCRDLSGNNTHLKPTSDTFENLSTSVFTWRQNGGVCLMTALVTGWLSTARRSASSISQLPCPQAVQESTPLSLWWGDVGTLKVILWRHNTRQFVYCLLKYVSTSSIFRRKKNQWWVVCRSTCTFKLIV